MNSRIRMSLLVGAVLAFGLFSHGAAARTDSSASAAVQELDLDLGWLRGRFDNTGAAGAEWEKRLATARARADRRREGYLKGLLAEGVQGVRLERSCFDDVECYLATELDRLAGSFSGWPDFNSALARAMPVFMGYRSAVEFTKKTIAAPLDKLASEDLLMERAFAAARVADQAYRAAGAPPIEGSPGAAAGGSTPAAALDPKGAAVFALLARAQAIAEGERNERLLSWYLGERGWPHGNRELSVLLWLLAQHSPDPRTQIRALRLMASHGPVPDDQVENYVFLADRIQTRLRGTQTYGTQYRCVSGKLGLVPVESEVDIAGRRRPAGYSPPVSSLSGRNC